MAYGAPSGSKDFPWRARYKRPDGNLGSKSGFLTEREAENWGNEQEALIRLNRWVDPRVAEMPFEDFAEECYESFVGRLSSTTASKYRIYLDAHLIPEWGEWSLIDIARSYMMIEKWVTALHEDYADSTVAAIFAYFSTILNKAEAAQIIPSNPCRHVRVTRGFAVDHLVASPVQALRGAMRLYESPLGLSGFTLCLSAFFSGARWGELAGELRSEYDRDGQRIGITAPLKEVGGELTKRGVNAQDAPDLAEALAEKSRPGGAKRRKKGRAKTPTSVRWVQMPPSIGSFLDLLLDSHDFPYVFVSPEGLPLRRGNFRQRYWRPAFDGARPDTPGHPEHRPAILRWFTFHETRHSHTTLLTEAGVPEVARRARLGQKMKGIANVYDHVTPVMEEQVLLACEQMWDSALAGLYLEEQRRLVRWFPHLEQVVNNATSWRQEQDPRVVAMISPSQHARTAGQINRRSA
ncbi:MULTISPECIES: site-specific integrase [unclassified Crossiella]|uniref:tyrosine-type recombinase/integrase n=1 Tax=unclassified Crossiella TaxID=2620835 RepID=UPI001FFFC9A0|nr:MULTISPECIES: site-specific integrase [unclassified Crossiella]MCK2243661.1 site-specific integrase [Crossiella sp. S99.2]MCK2257520.1 site-specific integrase [Crossiella sp. S99.1]